MPKYKKDKNKGKTVITTPANKTKYFFIVILAVITFITFANGLRNNFLTWDDPDYVTENFYIRDLSVTGVKAMFSVFVSCHYHPLTLLSLALDYAFWGQKPAGFIFMNILLHILNVILVNRIFFLFTKKTELSFITALLFAIHPMRVESVVWIAERKDVLFAFFYLFSIFFYVKFLKQKTNFKYYLISFLLFVLSLFSKATATSLPLILILFDYFSDRKDIRRILLEKIPFFILSLLFGLVAIKAQSLASSNAQPLVSHIFLITYAIAFYIFKFFAPFFQSAVMPFPEVVDGLLPLKYYLSFLIIPLMGFIIYYFRKYRKELIFSFSFFILTLILVLVKFPIGPAYLAERYTYLPYIGFSYFIGFAYINYKEKYKLKNNWSNIYLIVLCLFTVFFIVKTISRNTVWKTSYSLFTDVVSKNPTYAFALNNQAHALASEGKHAEAISIYALAVKNKPDFAEAYNNRAASFFALKDYESVIKDLSISIEISPDNPKIANMYNNRGLAYYNLKRYKEAIDDLNKAISINKDFVEAYKTRMNSNAALQNYDKALNDLNFIMTIEKNNAEHYNQAGIFYAEAGDKQNAIKNFSKAIDIEPSNSSYYLNLGFVYTESHKDLACSNFLKAKNLGNQQAHQIYQELCLKQ